MIVSMTGFGKASKQVNSVAVSVEVRSINSKSLEMSCRLPQIFMDKENDVREIISQKVTRGKVSVNVSLDKNVTGAVNLKVQPEVVKDFHKLLAQIKKEIGSNEEIKIDHLLKFSEIFKADDTNEFAEEWDEVKKVISEAVKDLSKMKLAEGKTLEKDITKRLKGITDRMNIIEKLSKQNLKDSKSKTRERVVSLAKDVIEVDEKRLEYELTLLNDKLDITEEIVRAKSHVDYFTKCMKEKELSGRRLNFLTQELNREINTMASKSNNSKISQYVVEMKEELEKIREQLQNVE